MSGKHGPPHELPATSIVGQSTTIELPTTYVGKQPKPGKHPNGGGFSVPPTRPGGIGPGITYKEHLRGQTLRNVAATEKSAQNDYAVKSQDLPRATEVEFAYFKTQYPATTSTQTQAYQHELNISNISIQQKTVELHVQTGIANAFYGHNPLNATVKDYIAKVETLEKTVQPYGTAYKTWANSYKAAYSAKLLTEQIQLLNNKQVHVQNLLAAAHAQDQRQQASDQEARRVAAEQERLAKEQETKRVAAEEARLAAEHKAQRVAAEQARLAAEQEAQRVAAEEARKAQKKRAAEEAAAKSRAEQDVRLKYLGSWSESLDTDQANRLFPVSGSAASVVPVFTVATGSIFTTANNALAIKDALRLAVAAVIAAFTTSTGVVIGGFAALLFPSPLSNSELYALSVPLSDLTPDDLDDLYAIAEASGEIELPVSIGSRTVDDTIEFVVAATNGTTVPSKVLVRLATLDPGQNIYRSYSPDAPSIGMTWTPIVEQKNASTTSPARESRIFIYNGTTPAPLEGRLDEYPELDLYSFGGFINVFPAESGIPPIYTMFRDRRDDPGVASGYGEPVLGIWLGSASQDNGAVIPNQIADKLRGQNFSSFRAFREALWRAAIADSELSKQFTANNIQEMKNGRAPFSRKDDRSGGKVKFELHHVNRVSRGGEIYDIENIRIVTPKRHSELHKGGN
ncbi:S-type pyocin domain-containing protein [Pseudomonas svalbardensis]|uniref:S-type pyocin domain-containing protein n=1 Tax=Pseudomonas svalbardensis TaxID=3042029 RepID=UPI0024B3290D|nr:S-type pyocin domain-containing protein [Pseudomonas sp. PMCC200367]